MLQFNAVVESNIHAHHLYERLGFTQLGTIPGGFRMRDGHYENICPYEALANRLGLSFADADEWDIELAYDGVHFTEEGHARFAKGLASCLGVIL